ncbi:MAG: hypothetical protein KDD60_07060, partial [Bdellovibrionales bacterium]|nr:hypothetical protein [Bdellovibrionales bacterium]
VEVIEKYFSASGHEYTLSEELRTQVKFQQMNLADRVWPRIGEFDLIFLRNVMIYFDLNTKRHILENCQKRLTPDGYLFLGSTETTLGIFEGFERYGNSGGCYRPTPTKRC